MKKDKDINQKYNHASSDKKSKKNREKNICKTIVLIILLVIIIILVFQNIQYKRNMLQKKNKLASNSSTANTISNIISNTITNTITYVPDIFNNSTANEAPSNANNLTIQEKNEINNNSLNSNIVINNNSSSSETVNFDDFEEVLSSNATYYIRVNNSQNVVNIYKKGEDGKHNIPFKVMLCSTGTYTPTCNKYPKKAYKTTGTKYRWATLQQNVYGQYATQITGNILFHSVPYSKYKNAGSLEYWEYDKLGTKASLGCIRLCVEDAKWIYDNITAGTVIEFYKDENPGPLGKPELETISDNIECRNWDPTDISENNPWNED